MSTVESKDSKGERELTVWKASLLVQMTVSPVLISIEAGTNVKFSMLTLCVVAAEPTVPSSHPGVMWETQHSTELSTGQSFPHALVANAAQASVHSVVQHSGVVSQTQVEIFSSRHPGNTEASQQLLVGAGQSPQSNPQLTQFSNGSWQISSPQIHSRQSPGHVRQSSPCREEQTVSPQTAGHSPQSKAQDVQSSPTPQISFPQVSGQTPQSASHVPQVSMSSQVSSPQNGQGPQSA